MHNKLNFMNFYLEEAYLCSAFAQCTSIRANTLIYASLTPLRQGQKYGYRMVHVNEKSNAWVKRELCVSYTCLKLVLTCVLLVSKSYVCYKKQNSACRKFKPVKLMINHTPSYPGLDAVYAPSMHRLCAV